MLFRTTPHASAMSSAVILAAESRSVAVLKSMSPLAIKLLTGDTFVSIFVSIRAKSKAGRFSREEGLDQPRSRTDPKAASLAKGALPRPEGQETRSRPMPRKPKSPFPPPPPPPGVWTIKKRDRNWMVIAPDGALVCITLYKKGAQEVVRRLAA